MQQWHLECKRPKHVTSCVLILNLEKWKSYWDARSRKPEERGEVPREVDNVMGSAGSRVAEHIAEAVAPLELVGQVGLASHEVVARLCGPFKGDDDLGIHLYPGRHTLLS